MANKNRTEVVAAIQAQSAVVGETEYKNLLDDDFAQSVIFRKDVSTSDTATGTTKTLNFLDIDYIEVAQSNNVTYTLNNIQQGEIKYLKITKSAAQTIIFANATDVSIRKDFINSITVVIYRITNKDGDLYVESVNIENDFGADLLTKIIDIGDWNLHISASGTSNPASGNPVHGIANGISRIRHIEIAILQDASAATLDGKSPDFTGKQGISVGWNDTTIALVTFTGNKFDNTVYDQTSFNRGWATVYYIP